MTITFTYANDCTENFKTVNGPDIEAYVRAHNTFAGQTFDNARILGGMHTTTSGYDPDATPHATVELDNAAMRARNPRQWYTLHWRREDGKSLYLRNPEDADAKKRKQTKKKNKKAKAAAKKAQAAVAKKGEASKTATTTGGTTVKKASTTSKTATSGGASRSSRK